MVRLLVSNALYKICDRIEDSSDIANMSDKIALCLLVVAVGVWLYDWFQMNQLSSRVKGAKNVPDSILNFPTTTTSVEEYVKCKAKIDDFANRVLDERSAQLFLDTREVNALLLRGSNIDKYQPGQYSHYEVVDSNVIERFIDWPVIYGKDNVGGFYRVISYRKGSAKQGVLEVYKEIYRNGKEVKPKETAWSILYSNLLFRIFGYTQSPRAFQRDEFTTSEYQRIKKILLSLEQIEVSDGHLVLTT